jgi:hypothetical protein
MGRCEFCNELVKVENWRVLQLMTNDDIVVTDLGICNKCWLKIRQISVLREVRENTKF